MRANAPLARLNGGGRSVGLEASISSISMLGPRSALVRFNVAQIGYNGRREKGQPYVATIAYGFRGDPMQMEDMRNCVSHDN
jgi:type IV secretion system protein VirB8